MEIDIATFATSPREIVSIERVPYGGLQTQWPPAPPRANAGVTYVGWRTDCTRVIQSNALAKRNK
jgi:hypothetical protein